jgi:hypothetical protein
MSEPSSPKATPKRKRDDFVIDKKPLPAPEPTVASLSKAVFSFEPPNISSEPPEDGNSSPRTKVANKFRDLSLESGGGVVSTDIPDARPDFTEIEPQHPKTSPKSVVFGFDGAGGSKDTMEHMQLDDDDDEGAMRKRHKHVTIDPELALGPKGESSAEAASSVQIDEKGKLQTSVDPAIVRTTERDITNGLKKSYPSINRLSDSKSRGRRRTGTPPLGASRRKATETVDEEPVIVDPVRAALTWHEDEITVYDSEDPNDDGTGLNGIGFRPTAAVAYQRAQKRKQQLSEYRKREESEARARRNQRRREQLGAGSELDRKHSLARVRFSDAEPEAVVMT